MSNCITVSDGITRHTLSKFPMDFTLDDYELWTIGLLVAIAIRLIVIMCFLVLTEFGFDTILVLRLTIVCIITEGAFNLPVRTAVALG